MFDVQFWHMLMSEVKEAINCLEFGLARLENDQK
jgi:hypothetical protein